MTALEDIKDVKGYIAGVVALAVAVGGFCALVFDWDKGVVTGITAAIAILAISFAILVSRAEKRNMKRLEIHQQDANKSWDEVHAALARLEELSIANNQSSIRIEMNQLINGEPENHDTIIAYAEKYFVELGGDWKETDKFLEWVDEETAAGRPVHVPPALFANVNAKQEAEKNTTR